MHAPLVFSAVSVTPDIPLSPSFPSFTLTHSLTLSFSLFTRLSAEHLASAALCVCLLLSSQLLLVQTSDSHVYEFYIKF